MNYLSVAQIREIDRKATEEFGIPSVVLMENAGRITAEEVLKYPLDAGVLAVCGSGNNAGDGFVAARYIHNAGFKVTVCLTKDFDAYKADALTNLNILNKMKIPVIGKEKSGQEAEIKKPRLIIDAVFGTGLKGKIDGAFKDMIELINGSGNTVIAVDIPSGLNGDTGIPEGPCIRAALTVTMGYAKKGFLNPDSREYTGKVIVADIGYPRDMIIA